MLFDFLQHTKQNLFIGDGELTANPGSNTYYCKCGNIFSKEKSQEEDSTQDEHQLSATMEAAVATVIKDIKISMNDVRCDKCNTSFSNATTKHNTVYHHEYFITGIKLIEENEDIYLYCSRIMPELTSNESVQFIEEAKYLRLHKETKRLFFCNYNCLESCVNPNSKYNSFEVEFDLDEVVKYSDLFFKFDTKRVLGLIDIHMYINRLVDFVVDANKTDIIGTILAETQKIKHTANEDASKKIVAIFFALIKYSNLSTLSLTKGPNFLYDLLVECEVPKHKELVAANVTSPLKIFNFLVANYVKKLNEDISSDKNVEDSEFVFKTNKKIVENFEQTEFQVHETEEKQLKIKVSDKTGYKEGKVKIIDGKYMVMDVIEDGSLSKFLFKSIDKFSEYAQLIKFFKLVNKQELIVLLNKYPKEYLVSVIDLLYFRDKISFKELQNILDIAYDYVAVESKKHAESIDGKLTFKMNYKHLYKEESNDTEKEINSATANDNRFSFIPYDDSLMMIAVLKFDRKRHFDKLKTWKELNEYHSYLANFYNATKEEDKSGTMLNFATRFKFLESKEDYSGPLDVKLFYDIGTLVRDGISKRHSGFSYAPRVARGEYLMGEVFDRDPNRKDDELESYTIGFNHSKNGILQFEQVKGFGNQRGPDRFKKLMIDWLTTKDIMFKPGGDLKLIESV